MYPEFAGLAAWSENCKWYSSLPLGAVVSLVCVSLESFDAIALCVASQRVFIVYFVIDSVWKLLDTLSYKRAVIRNVAAHFNSPLCTVPHRLWVLSHVPAWDFLSTARCCHVVRLLEDATVIKSLKADSCGVCVFIAQRTVILKPLIPWLGQDSPVALSYWCYNSSNSNSSSSIPSSCSLMDNRHKDSCRHHMAAPLKVAAPLQVKRILRLVKTVMTAHHTPPWWASICFVLVLIKL
jgi:hypothetical protein